MRRIPKPVTDGKEGMVKDCNDRCVLVNTLCVEENDSLIGQVSASSGLLLAGRSMPSQINSTDTRNLSLATVVWPRIRN